MKENLRNTAEAELEGGEGGVLELHPEEWREPHVTHSSLFPRFSPGCRHHELGISQGAPPKDGVTGKAAVFISGLEDSRSLPFGGGGGGDKRDGITALSFTMQTSLAGTADLQRAWTGQERIRPLSPALHRGPRITGVGWE